MKTNEAKRQCKKSDNKGDVQSESRTRIVFDLKDILTTEELEQFLRSAEEAHAPNLTEHLLNITLRTKEAA